MKHTHTHFQLLWRISEALTTLGPCSLRAVGNRVLLSRQRGPFSPACPVSTMPYSLRWHSFCGLAPMGMEFATHTLGKCMDLSRPQLQDQRRIR